MVIAASWWEETARSVGLIGGTLLVLVGVFRTVPPFRQIARYVWRRLIRDPLHEWFKRAVSESNRESIRFEVRTATNKAIGRSVPGAVQRSFESKMEPKIEQLRQELVEHMGREDEARDREDAFRSQVLSRLIDAQRTAHSTEGRVTQLEERVAHRATAALEGHVVLTPRPEPDLGEAGGERS